MRDVIGKSGHDSAARAAPIGQTGEIPNPHRMSGKTPTGFVSTPYARYSESGSHQICYHAVRTAHNGSPYGAVPETTTYAGSRFLPRSWAIYGSPYPHEARALSVQHRQELETKALLSLLSDGFDVSPTLAESVETANYLATRTRDLFSVLSLVKRGKMTSGARRVLREFGVSTNEPIGKSIGSRYLEYKYAIRPLASDVAALASLHSDGLEAPLNVEGKGFKVDEYDDTLFVSTGFAAALGLNVNRSVKDIELCRLYYRVSDPQLRAASLLGVADIQNSIMKGAWELVPYSFMVDWGIGIGDYLAALTADFGLEFISGHVSRRYSNKCTAAGSSEPFVRTFSRYYETVTDKSDFAFNCESYTRQVLTSSPSPSVVITSPFSTGNIMSTVAILSNFRK